MGYFLLSAAWNGLYRSALLKVTKLTEFLLQAFCLSQIFDLGTRTVFKALDAHFHGF